MPRHLLLLTLLFLLSACDFIDNKLSFQNDSDYHVSLKWTHVDRHLDTTPLPVVTAEIANHKTEPIILLNQHWRSVFREEGNVTLTVFSQSDIDSLSKLYQEMGTYLPVEDAMDTLSRLNKFKQTTLSESDLNHMNWLIRFPFDN